MSEANEQDEHGYINPSKEDIKLAQRYGHTISIRAELEQIFGGYRVEKALAVEQARKEGAWDMAGKILRIMCQSDIRLDFVERKIRKLRNEVKP